MAESEAGILQLYNSTFLIVSCSPLHDAGERSDGRGGRTGARGRAVQVGPIKPTLKAPGTQRFKLEYDVLLSSFAFILSLRRFTAAAAVGGPGGGDEGMEAFFSEVAVVKGIMERIRRALAKLQASHEAGPRASCQSPCHLNMTVCS